MKDHIQKQYWPLCNICEKEKRHPQAKRACRSCYDFIETLKKYALIILVQQKLKTMKMRSAIKRAITYKQSLLELDKQRPDQAP